MKKLLMILICGFAFSQSIQTKQVEVTITDFSDINLYDLIDTAVGGNYSVQFAEFQLNDCTNQDFENDYIEIIGNEQLFDMNATRLYFVEDDYIGAIPIFDNGNLYINSNYGSLTFFSNWNPLIFPENASITLKFWVTGMFEDEGIGLQGDMNGDEMLNVVDIVSLVNIIIND